MVIKKSIFLIFIIGAICAVGCKTQTPKLPSNVALPETFGGKGDTINIGTISRKEFFADTNLLVLIDTAIKNNYDVQNAYQRIQFSAADVRIAKGRFLPNFSPELSARVDRFGRYTMNGVGNYDTNFSPNIDEDRKIPNPTPDLYLGFRTSWEIGLWGKFRNMKKASIARFLASEKGRHLIITNLVAEVARLYYELLALDNELLTTSNNIVLQEAAVDIIRVMKDAGRSNELAIKQFEAQLLDTRSIEIELQQEIIEVENRLNFLLARFPQPIKRGSPIRDQVFPSKIQAGIPSSLLTQRPDIVQAELELVAAKADIKVARATFFPTLNIGAYAGYNAFKPKLLLKSPESIALGALAGLSAPLWNQAIIKSNYRRSNAQQIQAYNNYQRSIVNSVQEVVTTMNGIENYSKIYGLKKEQTEALYEAVAASKELFVAGKASYLEVITAQKNVLQAELEWSEVRKKQFISLIDLYKALGGGWQ